MRFKIVFAIVFSACWGISILNFFSFIKLGYKSDLLYAERSSYLKDTPTEILICEKFVNKIFEHLHQIPTEKEMQEILHDCRLFLRQNLNRSTGKNGSNFVVLQPSKDYNTEQQMFVVKRHSPTESFQETSNINSGWNETLIEISGRAKHNSNDPSQPLFSKDLKEFSTIESSKLATEEWSLWNYFFGYKGTNETLSEISGYIKIDNAPSEPLSRRPLNVASENGSSKLTTEGWSLWNYLFGNQGSSSTSSKIRNTYERDPIAETGLNFEMLNKPTADTEKEETGIGSLFLILPGTKWCGLGNISANDDDLGYFEDADRCCRTHDKCNDIMTPGESKYNLTNTSSFTALNCKCDDELYDCLIQINSVVANTLGNLFFNIFSRSCYTLDYPRKCKKHYELFHQWGCMEYEIDYTAEKVYQWKPAKKYFKTPSNISMPIS